MFYLAEFYLPAGASLADVAERARAGVAQAAGAGAQVSFVPAIFVPSDESCFVLYRAGSAVQVIAAGTEAGLVFDRVVEALASEAPDY
jgi:hypothetical protein